MRERLDLRGALVGGAVWLGLWAVPWPTDGIIERIERLILLAPLVLVSLALLAVATPDRLGKHAAPYRWASRLHWIASLSLIVGAVQPAGMRAALLVLPWLAIAVMLAMFGLQRLSFRGLAPIEELCIDAGLLYLPIGAVWLFCARARIAFLGYDEPTVLLTAAHFHFAGFAAPIIVGVLGRRIAVLGAATRRLYRVSAVAVMLGPPLVAVGIMGSRALETAATFTLATGLVLFGVLAAVTLAPREQGISRLLVLVAACAPCFSMVLACSYVLGLWRDRPYIDLATMVQLHGSANALGFSLFGLAAAVRLRSVARATPMGIPFSRLRSRRLRIGAQWFRDEQLIRPEPVHGLLHALEDLASPAGGLDAVHPAIRAFYEDTDAHVMHVHPVWRPGFRALGRMYVALAQRLGQLVLPVDAGEDWQVVTSSVERLDEERDGRPGARSSVRTYASGQRAMYVAAYATHRHADVGYMNIALPLFCGNLSTVLRLDTVDYGGDQRGIVLCSKPRVDEVASDAGVWFVCPLGSVRVPLAERLEMWDVNATSPPASLPLPMVNGTILMARHRFTIFGMLCLTLHYCITRRVE